VLGCALAAAAAAAAAAGADGAVPSGSSAIPAANPSLSSNWAGYAVSGAHRVRHFRRVTGTWVQPAVTCTPGKRAYSAFWVGLGGLATNSQGLEQTGTEADCDARGGAHYSAWYELVPAGSVTLRLRITPGDTIKAIVSVTRRRVTMVLRDLTTGSSVKAVRRARHLDTTSAEWIAEAPLTCNRSGNRCSSLPLGDFTSVTFRGASARLRHGHHGAIASRLWSVTAIALSEPAGRPKGHRRFATRRRVTATPTTLGPRGSSFAVFWALRQRPGPPGPARLFD
jgi:Peptidase A4 family